jgi:glutamine synthetase
MASDSKYKLEYVWLDGYLPEPNLRSKTKIVGKQPTSVADLPLWGFDGSGALPRFDSQERLSCDVRSASA